MFAALKRYMPRSLYGRAALILALPVLTLQLVISVVFIQRHFEDVTEQMTRNMLADLTFILERMEAEPGAAEALARGRELGDALRFEAELPASRPPENARAFYDISGLTVRATLEAGLPGLAGLDLGEERRVTLWVQTRYGLASFRFSRRMVSASNPHQLLVHMVVFGVLMTGVSYLFLRNQLRPIKRLSAAAQAFGRGRTEPYRPSGALEVRAAGHAFLDMRARIERQIEQRTLLLSGVSHDLRTPLTRLRLGLSMLDEEEAAPLRQDVEEMQRMLDEFLDFARGEAAGEIERIDPGELVKGIVADAARAGQAVRFTSASGEGEVALRPIAMRRALENLIGNAVRYGSRAEVSLALSDRALRISVEDDGPGIPPDRREEALRPFARLDPARNQDRGSGVGLGLAIASDIARAHGGTLRLGESERLGGLRADLVIAR